MKQLNTNIQFFLETQAQFRILHWQTKGYARHMAFGGIYDALDDLIDKFVEVAMGKYGRFKLGDGDKSINIKNISEVELTAFIKNLQTKLIDISKELDDKDSDLANIRDEMLAEVNKLAYLLTLE